jgi:hypothetical protein
MRQPEDTGQRAFIPPWLSNKDFVAPCMCGTDLEDGEPFLIAESDVGLKRWWHPVCFHYFMNPSYTDDD